MNELEKDFDFEEQATPKDQRGSTWKSRFESPKTFLLMLACLGIFAIVCCYAIYLISASVPVVGYHPARSTWTLRCKVTGKGEDNAKISFHPLNAEWLARDGHDPSRALRGDRVSTEIVVESGRSGVMPGKTYKVTGTITDVDLFNQVVYMTDCVFK